MLKKTDVVATPQLLWLLQRNTFLEENGYNSKASRPLEVEDSIVFIYFYIFQKKLSSSVQLVETDEYCRLPSICFVLTFYDRAELQFTCGY